MNSIQPLIYALVALSLLGVFINATDVPTYKLKNQAGNVTCLLMKAVIKVDVDYKNSTNATVHVSSSVPGNATTTGNCSADSELIKLYWSDGDNDLMLGFHFNKTADGKRYLLANLTLTGDYGKHDTKLNMTGPFRNFTTDVGFAYNCSKQSKLSFGTVTVSLQNFTVDAFKNDPSPNPVFRATGTDCYIPPPSATDAIVPIAVGAALAAMVVIVLIGYCIGRRKTRAGYSNMNA